MTDAQRRREPLHTHRCSAPTQLEAIGTSAGELHCHSQYCTLQLYGAVHRLLAWAVRICLTGAADVSSCQVFPASAAALEDQWILMSVLHSIFMCKRSINSACPSCVICTHTHAGVHQDTMCMAACCMLTISVWHTNLARLQCTDLPEHLMSTAGNML